MSLPHMMEVSVGDRKSLLINAHPRFDLGDGVWRGFQFWSRVFGTYESTVNKPVPFPPVNYAMDISCEEMYSWSLGIVRLHGFLS